MLKNLNVNVMCLRRSLTKCEPIHTIKSDERWGKYVLDDFTIGVFISALGTRGGKDPECPMDCKETLDVSIRLTRATVDVDKRLTYKLADTKVNLLENVHISEIEVPYSTQNYIIDVKDLAVQEKGTYMVRVVVKREKDEEYEVLGMARLDVV